VPIQRVPSFVGHNLFILTDWNAPNLRIISFDTDKRGNGHWRDIVTESTLRIKDFAIAGNFVCVGYVENVSSRIDLFHLTGRLHGEIPCPPQGTARLIRRPVETDTLFYTYSSFNQPQTIFSYDPVSGEQTIWAKNEVPFDSSSIEVRQIRYKSRDATEIPMFLVARKGRRLSGSPPVFLTAYGGFCASLTPQFYVYSTFLVEQGFLFAVANVRGGGEFGVEWHEAGKRRNRQNAINDFIFAVEWLLANGAIREKIAIGGGSNAGLLVGAVLTQRPELFRAVLCLGPLLDMVRYHLFDSARSWANEYGCSEDQEDFRHLFAYSPYHNVREAVPYPAVLFVSGGADTRCNPMHVCKMAAKLQTTTTSRCPILLDYKPTWGHAPVQPLNRRIEALTDRVAFVCNELGVNVR
jgi:prolyl oligopeptidase